MDEDLKIKELARGMYRNHSIGPGHQEECARHWTWTHYATKSPHSRHPNICTATACCNALPLPVSMFHHFSLVALFCTYLSAARRAPLTAVRVVQVDLVHSLEPSRVFRGGV